MSGTRLLGGLLAAGRSRRFGSQDKLLAPLAGRPLLTFAARRLHDAGCDALVAVSEAPVHAVLDSAYARLAPASEDAGLGDNLALLARYAQARKFSFLLVHLGDMPLVPADHLRALFERTGDRRPAASAVGQRLQVPCCFPASWYGRLADLSGDAGAGKLLSREDCRAVDLQLDHAMDADDPGDLARLEAILSAIGDDSHQA